MSDVLCIYYSRTGHTKKAMEEVAAALGAELLELSDGIDRSGALGAFRSGLDAAYLIPRGSEDKCEEVYGQMDLYTPCGHQAAVSLRSGSVGYAFWQEEFLRQVRELLGRQ